MMKVTTKVVVEKEVEIYELVAKLKALRTAPGCSFKMTLDNGTYISFDEGEWNTIIDITIASLAASGQEDEKPEKD